jgi:hypothetical protein
MPNSYYNHSIYPTPNAPGSSAALRAELDLITAGFSLLPTLSGNGYKVAMVNAGGTALIASSALQSLAITSSTIDSTPIGATTRAAGNFTNLSVNGTAGLGSSVTIAGGTINNTIIGGTTPVAGYFTTLSATSGLTGNVTGNLTGNVTGNVLGNLTGNVTGNVTATSGTSQFNNVTINGQLDMDAGSSATIINLPNPTNNGDAANKGYVDTQDALKLSLAGGTMSGAIAMGTNRITGMGDPVNAQDAATKIYVDNSVQGLDAKASCRVATTANITLSGTQTIDGVAVIAGDRVLVKDQSTASENGIYIVAAGSWSRSADANTWDELVHAYSFVEAGTAGANNGYVCTVTAGGTLGSTAVTWVQFSGAGQVIAGTGMTKTGNTLNVNTASASRIVVGADEIDLATTGVSAGTYRSVTVDLYGRVTAGTNPTTLAGYGITDAYTTTQVDSALALKLNLSGGTMSGQINMGTNRITNMADPSSAQDAATKNYIDTIFGSTTSAAASASAAATSATNAANSATSASGSATTATNAANAAAASYDDFDDRYLGPKTSNPTVDNDGNPLQTGALYFNTSAGEMRVWNGSSWVAAYLPAAGYVAKTGDTMTGLLTLSGAPTTNLHAATKLYVDTLTTGFGWATGSTANYGTDFTVDSWISRIYRVLTTAVSGPGINGGVLQIPYDGTPNIVYMVMGGSSSNIRMFGGWKNGTVANSSPSWREFAPLDTPAFTTRIGVGSATSTQALINANNSASATGNAIFYGMNMTPTIASDVTTAFYGVRSAAPTEAAAFTLPLWCGFQAGMTAVGAGSTITSAYGFIADSSVGSSSQVVNAYGLYSNLSAGIGTSRWNIYAVGSASNYMAGSLGVGSATLTGFNLRLDRNMTGATSFVALRNAGTALSDVTSSLTMYDSVPFSTAAAFTIPILAHYRVQGVNVGAGSTVSNQYGFRVLSNLNGATNNFAFQSDVAAASGVWNLYMAGNAANYLAGDLIINSKLGIGSAGSPSYGTSGQVLTSAGSGAAPTWSTPSGISTGKAIAMAIVFG